MRIAGGCTRRYKNVRAPRSSVSFYNMLQEGIWHENEAKMRGPCTSRTVASEENHEGQHTRMRIA
jgi:hypothetical protein